MGLYVRKLGQQIVVRVVSRCVTWCDGERGAWVPRAVRPHPASDIGAAAPDPMVVLM